MALGPISIGGSVSGYTLPTATGEILGGVKTGENITNTDGTISISKENVTTALGYTPPTATDIKNLDTTKADKTTLEDLEKAKADKMEPIALTIPATGWQTDGSVSYPYYIDFSIAGIKESDCIGVTVSPDDSDIAKVACFTTTEAKNGTLRLRARNIPTKALNASYYFIRDDIVKAFGFEALNVDPYVLPMATKSSLGGIIVGDGLVINALGQLSVSISYEEFMLIAHPVGSPFFTIKDDNPAELFGGTWVKIAENRAIMGASGTHAAGTIMEAGLPNITATGGFYENLSRGDLKDRLTGAFYVNANDQTHTGSDGSDMDNPTLNFDASRSNPIYGRSSTVQPAAYYMNIWLRTA